MLSISEPEYLPAWPDVCIALSSPPFLPRSIFLSGKPPPPKPFVSERERLKADTRGAKRQPLANLRSRKRIHRTVSYVRMQFIETHVPAGSNGYYCCGPLLVSPSPAEIRPRECRQREKIAPADPSIAPSDLIRLENPALRCSVLSSEIIRPPPPPPPLRLQRLALNYISLTGEKTNTTIAITKLRRRREWNVSSRSRQRFKKLTWITPSLNVWHLNCSQPIYDYARMHKNHGSRQSSLNVDGFMIADFEKKNAMIFQYMPVIFMTARRLVF